MIEYDWIVTSLRERLHPEIEISIFGDQKMFVIFRYILERDLIIFRMFFYLIFVMFNFDDTYPIVLLLFNSSVLHYLRAIKLTDLKELRGRCSFIVTFPIT